MSNSAPSSSWRRCVALPVRQTTLLLAAVLALACGGPSGEEAAAGGPQAFTVSGTIPVVGGTAADSDVNDPASTFTSNNSIATAQEIANPVTLGGYVNAPGTGPAGRSQAVGDAVDYFRVALADGQVVRLTAAEEIAQGDLDLALLTEAGAPVAASDTLNQTEEIVVAATGTFLIEVSADTGFSNYMLTIGQMAAGAGAVIADGEFVAGEVIVEFDDGSLGSMASMSSTARAQTVGMTHMRGDRDGPMLLGCQDEATRSNAIATLGLSHLVPERPEDLALDAESREKRETRRIVKALRRQAGVRAASLNYIRKPTATPTDEHYPLQWHYEQINLPTAWDNLIASPVRAAQPVLVAVIDTGITFHPDLQGQLVAGYDFIQEPLISADGDGCDSDATDPGDGLVANTSSFHGTHVTGTVAARTSLQAGGDAEGVAGVAFDSRVMPLRVLGKGGGTDFDIMQAILYAADLDNDCGQRPVRRASVINMSLGGPGMNPLFQTVIDQARAEGVVIVAAAGNEASTAPSYPAAYNGVISVSAVDINKGLTPYSNSGSTIDVTAPGGDLNTDFNGDAFADGVLSTWFDENDSEFKFSFLQGTSMAAPHVAGVIAMMLDINGALTPNDIDAMLAAGDLTEDLGTPGSFGAGLIDAFKAVSAALASVGQLPPANQPLLVVDPGTLNFGALGGAVDVEVRNGGGNAVALNVSGATVTTDDGASWLIAAPTPGVDANNLGDWQISVDRNQVVSDGIYTGTVLFDSDQNDVSVSIIMQKGGAGTGPADAGHHFVLLVDPDTSATVRLIEVDASGGSYSYNFSEVPPGDYLIVAGTDLDNDLTICDAGEACGGYPSRDNITPVTISKNESNLGFSTGFSQSIGASAASVGGGSPRDFSRPPVRGISR